MSKKHTDSKYFHQQASTGLIDKSHTAAHPAGKHLKKRRKTRMFKPLIIAVFLGVSFIFAKAVYNDTKSFLAGRGMPHASYQELLSTSIDDITEALNSSELHNPIFMNLIRQAKDYPEAKILLANHDVYPEILLEFASNRPEVMQFVIDYPYYHALGPAPISIAEDYQPGSIPLFIQWDTRWGYEAYGNEFISTSACGPTALSMVIVGLTGDMRWNPKAVADFSFESGYFYSGQGTSWNLMSEGARKFGLQSTELPLDASVIISRLKSGQPIIVSVGPGHFTNNGHFIVLTGISSDGRIIVNDPGSIENSHMTWDLETIMNETKNLWAFSPLTL